MSDIHDGASLGKGKVSWNKLRAICERIKKQVEDMKQQIIGSSDKPKIPLEENRKKDILEYFETVAKKLKQE